MDTYTPMVVAAARKMCALSAEACGIDNGDNWKIYGDSFLQEAEEVLEAAGATSMLETLMWLDRIGGLGKTAHEQISAAIAKATGKKS